MKGSAGYRRTVTGLGLAVGGVAAAFLACSGGDNPGKVPKVITVAPDTVYGEAGAPCQAPAGSIPNPECDDGTESLCTATTSCNLSSCQATSTAKGSCEPLTTNPPGGPWDFRMRRIIIVAPPALASSAVQNSVVTNGVDMNENQCGEEGTGDFSWLIHLDTTNPSAMTVTTGGAPPCDIPNPTMQSPFPSCNPFTTGYCFLQSTVGSIPVGPVTAPVQVDTSGNYQATVGTLNIPIFYNGSIIVLPIDNGQVHGVHVSDNGSCIGSFNPDALDNTCADQYQNCSKWLTGGSLTGFITLEQADQVNVLLLSKTLCAILTSQPGDPNPDGGAVAVCHRDSSGNIVAKGDYCSTTGDGGAPGGCGDSYWLAATFAASAVKINGTCTLGDGGVTVPVGDGG